MAAVIIGYARTSTADQDAGLDAQVRDLKAAGCSLVYSEKVSSCQHREKLDEAIDALVLGDTLMVTKIDRLARSTVQLLSIVDSLTKRGIRLIILSMGGDRVDTKSPTGRLMLTMLGAVAEFERTMMLERQREGILVAKAENRYIGNHKNGVPDHHMRARVDSVLEMIAEGVSQVEVARRLGSHRNSIRKVLQWSDPEEWGTGKRMSRKTAEVLLEAEPVVKPPRRSFLDPKPKKKPVKKPLTHHIFVENA